MSNNQLAEFEKLMEEKAGLKGLSEFENMMKSLKVDPSNPLSEPIQEPKPKKDISNKFFEALELKKVELNQLKGLSEFENMMKSLTVDLSNPLIEPIEEPKKAGNVLEDKSIEKKLIEEEPKHNHDLISNVTSLIERDVKEGKLKAINEQLSQTESERIDRLERWISRIASTGPGSGETKLLRLDDVDTTDLGNGKFLKYNSSSGKFVFAAGTSDSTSALSGVSLDIEDLDSEAVAILHRNQTGSNGNSIGKLKLNGENSASEEITFAQINGIQKTVTDGSEDGQIDFDVMNGGTLNTTMMINEDGIDIEGTRTIKFGGADAFRIVTTQASTALAISTALSGYAINDSIESDGRIKIEIDGVEYYIPIYNV